MSSGHRGAELGLEPRVRCTPASVIPALSALLVALGAVVMFLRLFVPQPRLETLTPSGQYGLDTMLAAVAPEQVRAESEAICSLGSRFLGQPGAHAVADYIRRSYRDAGLEVYEQDNWTVAPKTIYSEFTSLESSADPPGTAQVPPKVYPFFPNHMQPMVTPEEGIEGRLVLVTPELLTTAIRFDDSIALVDAREDKLVKDFFFYWRRYAQLGFEAMIVAHPDGMEAATWHWMVGSYGTVASVPVNYVRLAATKEVFNYVGQRVRLRVRTEFARVRNATIIGLLRSGNSTPANPAKDVLIIQASYDACSILPDVAPGALQSLAPATQLCLLRGLAPYKKTMQRDVMFVSGGAHMMAADDENNLIRVLNMNTGKAAENRLAAAFHFGQDGASGGKGSGGNMRMEPLQERYEENETRLGRARSVLALFEAPSFLVEGRDTVSALARLDKGARAFFDEQYQYVLNSIVFDLNEPKVQAKTALERDGSGEQTQSAVFQDYQEKRRTYEEAVTASGYAVSNLLDKKRAFVAKHDIRGRLHGRFEELVAYHEQRKGQLEQDMQIVRLFDPYESVLVIQPFLMPACTQDQGNETLSFGTGELVLEAQAHTFRSVLASVKARLGLTDQIAIAPLSRWHEEKAYAEFGMRPDAWMWAESGFPAYTLGNFGRSESYARYAYPVALPFMKDLETIRNSLAVTGGTVLSLAHGTGVFPPTRANVWQRRSYGGRVLASNVGQSVVPNYPLKNALVGCRGRYDAGSFAQPGCYCHPLYFTDVYGRFDLPNMAADFPNWYNVQFAGNYSPIAAAFGPDGLITYMKDEGEDGQRLYKSVGINIWDLTALKSTTVVTFRASPVTILDLTNPQTMKDYTAVALVDRDGLGDFRKRCMFQDRGIVTTYVEPHERFYVELQSGSPDNEYALVTRAFALGTPDAGDGRGKAYTVDSAKTIDGPGFLAADTPYLLDMPQKVARSMAAVNGKRLALQSRYGMADKLTYSYQKKSMDLLAKSEDASRPQRAATLAAQDSVTYSILNHPVLRGAIFEAVVGILWYLGLLVPFVFFFEKLIFAFPDIRKQLAAQAAIFVLVFVLLRILHPAFQMVRSPLMILLSFVIVLVSGGTLFLFSGKFQENLEEIRKRRGKVGAAEVNTLAAIGLAFVLGLNNMHRRRVRTWLTCATLTLLTFVMVCFTSTQNNLVDKITALGKAPYQGFLVKREQFRMMSPDEVFALKDRYGDRFDVCERRMVLGREDWVERQRYNPELTMTFQGGGREKKVQFDSVLQFSWKEPMRNRIRLLTDDGWFTETDEQPSGNPIPILISDTMAQNLGISPSDVNEKRAGGALRVAVNGKDFVVRGIFDAEALNNLRDLDDIDLLPYDIEAMKVTVPETSNVLPMVLAQPDDPRIPAERLILTPLRDLQIRIEYGLGPVTMSLAVSMPDATYEQARGATESYMEQTGKPTFYGLSGVSYVGERTRQTTLYGMMDLLLPLVIAALTVLNTMRGSVYERRDEIAVYNAVGIAPRHVFFIFFAEAFVYAVVGSMLGYILSQGAGRILTALNLTGGLNMTFASTTVVYASLAIAATVFLSTYFPARSAMQIAAPAEESGWRIPEPDGDNLAFDLPFTFSRRDRVAVLAFFERYLRDHGEGGAGRFFAGDPDVGVSDKPDVAAGDAYVPQITSMIWLKPFDLGVSQWMDILLPWDEQTREYKAQIVLTRLSGTRQAWLRLNKGFVAIVRRHFLYWRAVSDDERLEMFEEAKTQMIDNLLAGKTIKGQSGAQ